MADKQRLAEALTGRLIGLARATDGNEHLISEDSTAVLVEGLLASAPDGDWDAPALEAVEARVIRQKREMVPNCFLCACPCGRTDDFDMERLGRAAPEIRKLKEGILTGTRALAVWAGKAAALGRHDPQVDSFFYKALILVGMEGLTADVLEQTLREAGQMRERARGLLEEASELT